VTYISSLVLTLLNTFFMSGVFIIFWDFFKVNREVFLHNRVATLVVKRPSQGGAAEMLPKMIQNPTYSS